MNSPGDRKAFLAAMSLAALVAAAPGAGAADILPHHAIYDLGMHFKWGDGTDVVASGIVGWTTEDHCETWMFEEAVLIRFDDGESWQYLRELVTFEAKDGSWFRFQDETRDPEGAELASGEAVAGETGRIVIEEPEPLAAPLPEGTLFPMQFKIDVLDRAANGERFMSHAVFDGSDAAATSRYATFVESKQEDGGQAIWNVAISAFTDTGNTGPDLEIRARLRDDGVIDQISFDDSESVVTLRLKELTELAARGC